MRVTIGLKYNLRTDYEMHEGWFEVTETDLANIAGAEDLTFKDRFGLMHFLAEYQAMLKMRADAYLDADEYAKRMSLLIKTLLSPAAREVVKAVLQVQ